MLGEDHDEVTSWLVQTTLGSWQYELCKATERRDRRELGWHKPWPELYAKGLIG